MRDKQIEEMDCKKCLHYEGCLKRFKEAKQILGMCSSTTEEEYFDHADDCNMFITGYRKASDVARGIAEEILDMANVHGAGVMFWHKMQKLANELKKKYTEGEG